MKLTNNRSVYFKILSCNDAGELKACLDGFFDSNDIDLEHTNIQYSVCGMSGNLVAFITYQYIF